MHQVDIQAVGHNMFWIELVYLILLLAAKRLLLAMEESDQQTIKLRQNEGETLLFKGHCIK